MNRSSQTQPDADQLLKNISDHGIYMLDQRGFVQSWNDGARVLHGYDEPAILGHSANELLPVDDDCDLDWSGLLETALREGRFRYEGWLPRKGANRFWGSFVIQALFDGEHTHTGYAVVVSDLSKRKETEEALRASETRFRLLVQDVTDYAIYMLDPEGYVSSWNAGAERFKGYRAEEILGEHFSRFYTPEDLAAGIPDLALRTAAEKGRFEAEGWRQRKDGRRFWANVVIDPIRDEKSGKLLGFTKITRDLTERKQAADALEQSREQLFQSQKMEAVGQLTGGIAHDFNNILMAILSSLRLARKRAGSEEEADNFIRNAMTAAERGATLTQRMLAFARKQELDLRPVEVEHTLREMKELLERTIGPGIDLELRASPNLPLVTGDVAQLELALLNLVVNARDAMPEGGTISISADFAQESSDSEQYVSITVSDEGEGMDVETLARAVDPFFTTKGIGKGTGLGLSMVRGMVEQSGGGFTLDSVVGQGTRAEIRLPIASVETETTKIAGSAPASETTNLKILAVDDDAIILLNTVTLLEEMSFTVFEASSGSEALAILEEEEIDLLITDYAMPGMTGAELAEKARNLNPGLRILLASGYADIPDGPARSLPRLAKPYGDDELNRAIREIVD